MHLLSNDKIETIFAWSNSRHDLKKMVGAGYSLRRSKMLDYVVHRYKLKNTNNSLRVISLI